MQTLYYIYFLKLQAESPSSGKFTALGIYLLTNLIFIVGAFIEFAFILLLQQHNEQQVQRQKQLWKWKNYWNGSTKSNEMQENFMENEIFNNLIPTYDIRKIDFTGFYAFGALYLLFNAIYWPIFLIVTFD